MPSSPRSTPPSSSSKRKRKKKKPPPPPPRAGEAEEGSGAAFPGSRRGGCRAEPPSWMRGPGAEQGVRRPGAGPSRAGPSFLPSGHHLPRVAVSTRAQVAAAHRQPAGVGWCVCVWGGGRPASHPPPHPPIPPFFLTHTPRSHARPRTGTRPGPGPWQRCGTGGGAFCKS